MAKVFKGEYGCGIQYDAARRHNGNQIKAARMRIGKAKRAGKKPSLRDAYIASGVEPNDQSE